MAIETSCDETAAAVVEDGRFIRSSVVHSQVEIHHPYGGVVPELASRDHLLRVMPVTERALAEADVRLPEIEGIAVTYGPGLVGSLLVGVQVAKALSYARGVPLIGINHLEGHLCAVLLSAQEPEEIFPFLGLLVSGGHTSLYRVDAFGDYRLLGRTRDDAAGEAFDKVAKALGLGYPGGAVIEKLARRGNPAAHRFPRALPRRDDLDFSFSGLKTAVALHLKRRGIPREGQALYDLCASFQQAVVDVLVRKTIRAAGVCRLPCVVLTGGVAANEHLRTSLARAAREADLTLRLLPAELCTDNAAMIAAAGHRRLMRGERSELTLNAVANLEL